MHRAGGTRGGFSGRGGQGSIKNRLGFQAPRRNAGVVVRGVGVVRGGGRLGIKTRLGAGKGVAAVAMGEMLDARQKINLNRVQTGRIADARQKIQEKRHKKLTMTANIKNLKITANLRENNVRAEMMPSPWMDRRVMGGIGGQTDMRGRLSRLPPRPLESSPPSRYTDSYSREMMSAGGFRSAGPPMSQMYSAPPSYHQSPMTMTRTVPVDRYHTMRIAPPSDDFMLTRTIRNPNVGYGGNSDLRSSQGVAKVAPSIQYGSYSRSISHDQPMDEDDVRVMQPRRIDYSSNSESPHKILVSNLQPSVTADDIVELFSDIGQLVSARMTSTGHAEVTYAKKYDALKAIEAYHNRLLDGSAMRVFMETSSAISSTPSGSSTGLKSASGASMKLPKSSSSIKIQPDLSAIHKVLFNPGSSGTRGLFKGGQ